MPEWGRIVAQYLKPGGTFFIVEHHPLADIFGSDDSELKAEASYFHSKAPDEYSVTGSYVGPIDMEPAQGFEWSHSLSDI